MRRLLFAVACLGLSQAVVATPDNGLYRYADLAASQKCTDADGRARSCIPDNTRLLTPAPTSESAPPNMVDRAPRCGDGVCQSGENSSTCWIDCF